MCAWRGISSTAVCRNARVRRSHTHGSSSARGAADATKCSCSQAPSRSQSPVCARRTARAPTGGLRESSRACEHALRGVHAPRARERVRQRAQRGAVQHDAAVGLHRVERAHLPPGRAGPSGAKSGGPGSEQTPRCMVLLRLPQ